MPFQKRKKAILSGSVSSSRNASISVPERKCVVPHISRVHQQPCSGSCPFMTSHMELSGLPEFAAENAGVITSEAAGLSGRLTALTQIGGGLSRICFTAPPQKCPDDSQGICAFLEEPYAFKLKQKQKQGMRTLFAFYHIHGIRELGWLKNRQLILCCCIQEWTSTTTNFPNLSSNLLPKPRLKRNRTPEKKQINATERERTRKLIRKSNSCIEIKRSEKTSRNYKHGVLISPLFRQQEAVNAQSHWTRQNDGATFFFAAERSCCFFMHPVASFIRLLLLLYAVERAAAIFAGAAGHTDWQV
ncbi:hypothetical protein CDAR_592421 [Caerostris darwini]|uniref:Uncharacterized protein n=1 Tax=Caerostris darwini TaxID=1538125 RepID=A0AAV4V7N8_9ARAC|nr:hypothetical protein CDAR_592421 [Caerostris darwini]